MRHAFPLYPRYFFGVDCALSRLDLGEIIVSLDVAVDVCFLIGSSSIAFTPDIDSTRDVCGLFPFRMPRSLLVHECI